MQTKNSIFSKKSNKIDKDLDWDASSSKSNQDDSMFNSSESPESSGMSFGNGNEELQIKKYKSTVKDNKRLKKEPKEISQSDDSSITSVEKLL